MQCSECHGQGTVWMGLEAEVECPSCSGAGIVPTGCGRILWIKQPEEKD